MSQGGAIRAGRAFVELFVEDGRFNRGLRRAQARLKAWGSGLMRVGGAIFAGVAAAMTPLLAAAKTFADMGSDMVDMSQRTGVAVEALSELGYAAEQSGGDVETLEAGLRKMQQKIVDAGEGSKSAASALKAVGLSAAKLQGLTPDEQFAEIADRLADIPDPAKRTAAAIDLFGKAGSKLLPLLQEGKDGMQELRDEAKRLGITMSTEDAQAAEAFGDELSKLWKVVKAGIFNVGAALAPLLSTLADTFTELAAKASLWIRENRRLIVQIFTILSVVGAIGAALVAAGVTFHVVGAAVGGFATIIGGAASGLLAFGRIAGVVFRVLGTGVGTIGKLLATVIRSAITTVVSGATAGFASLSAGIAAVATPVGVLGIALVALAAIIVVQSGAIGRAIEGMGKLWGNLKTDALTAWGAISTALARGDLAAAANVAWTGLKLAWVRGTAFLQEQWIEFTNFLKSVFNNAWSNISAGIINGVSAIAAGWTETVDFLADVWSLFTSGLMKTWNTSIGFIKKAWVRLKGLFDKDVNVQAEVDRINKETDGKNQAVDADRDKKIGGRDAERRRRLQEIEDERKAALEANEEIRNGRDKDARAASDARIAALEEELKKAQEEFQKSVDEANQEATKPEVAKKADDLKKRVGEVEFKSAGSFSSRAAAGLGVASSTQKMLNHLDAIEKNTKEAADNAGQEVDP